MPRTTGVFVKRVAKRKRSNKRVAKRRVKRRLTNAKLKDIVSRKKRDTMGSVTAVGGVSPYPVPGVRGQSFAQRPGFSDSPHFNLWCASYRIQNTTPFDTVRNQPTVYMKGLKDTYRIEIQNAAWQWRRVVFASHERFVGTNLASATYAQQTIGGAATANNRIVGQGATPGQPSISIEGQTAQVDVQDIVFRGNRGIDWINVFMAPVDTRRVKLLSDQKFRLSSGNESGAAKVKNFYTPINKTLIYDDDELGINQGTSGFASSAGGVGNIYVMDVFWNETGGDQTEAGMNWNANATLYWHEH